MTRALLPVSLMPVALALLLSAHAEEAPKLHRERIEWCDIWFTDAEKEALPRVLLIGDSITRGYFDGVERALQGKAYLGRLTTSRSVGDPVFFDELALVLRQYPFAVIHVNNGLHGWDYTETEYRAGFERLLATLRKDAPTAKIICANTTPVREDPAKPDQLPRITERNRIATELCAASKIPVNDLHAIVAAHPAYFTGDGVHLNEEGRAALASAVTAHIQGAMEVTSAR